MTERREDAPLLHPDAPFDDDEARGLEAWPVDAPAWSDETVAGLVERAAQADLRRPGPDPRGARRVGWWSAGAGAILAVGVMAVWWAGSPSEVRGAHFDGARRSTVLIGTRATVVAEAGARLTWQVGTDGEARVQQPVGNAFYRVERGGPFEVDTPNGAVRVLGTSFRVEVMQVDATRAGLLGAGAGALAATIVAVTVYEGRVVTESEAGAVTLEAGEAARMRPGAAPRKTGANLTSRGVAPDETDEGPAPRLGGGRPARALAVGRAEPGQRGEVGTLAVEAQKLRARVAELEEALHEATSDDPNRSYDLDETTLRRMAERCELRWDHPPLGPNPPNVSPEDATEVGLTDEEREVADRALADSHRSLIEAIRGIYIEVTRDPNAGSMAAPAMIAEIQDKTSRAELKRVFQQVARERAGLSPPPPEGAGRPAVERLFRLLVASGDSLQEAIGGQLGPDRARALRDLHNGWGSVSRSSNGCP